MSTYSPTEAFQVPAHFEEEDLAQHHSTQLRARALARLAFGVVLVVGTFAMVFAFATKVPTATVFALTWILAFAAWAVVRAVMALVPTRVDKRTDPLFATSYAFVGAGVGLFAPLTVHCLAALLFGLHASDHGMRNFDSWVAMSAALVGAAHIALAYQLAARAIQLADGEQPNSVVRVFWTVVGWSCVPGAICFMVPPILVAITGLAFIPFIIIFDASIDREYSARRA